MAVVVEAAVTDDLLLFEAENVEAGRLPRMHGLEDLPDEHRGRMTEDRLPKVVKHVLN